MKQHDADHQSKAVWRAVDLRVTGKSISKGIIAAESEEELKNLWFSHFYNLITPVTSSESDTNCDNFPTGIQEEFKNSYFHSDAFDMEEKDLAVKSLPNT
jgi:hypothetical protein